MLGIIFAAIAIGGIICAIIAVSTDDKELRGLAVKGVADAIKAFVLSALLFIGLVAGGVYVLIKLLHY